MQTSEPEVTQEKKGLWIFRFGGIIIKGTFDGILAIASGIFKFASLLNRSKVTSAFDESLHGKSDEDL